MDDIFGGSGVGTAPPGTVTATPLFPSQTSLSSEDQPPTQSAPAEDHGVQPQEPRPPARHRARPPQRRLPSFQETYESHAERRTTALESLVRPELARWRRLKERRRRSFEKKMVTCMGQIVSQLKEIGKQQEKIISLLEHK